MFGKLINNIKNPYYYFNIIIIIYVILFILSFIKKKCETYFIPDLLTHPRSLFFTSLIDKYSENYKSIKMGSNISRINLATLIFRECFLHFIMDIVPHLVIVFTIGMLFLFININIGLIIFLFIILCIITIIYYKNDFEMKLAKACKYYYNNENDLNDIFSSLINTYLNNNEVKEKEKIINSHNIYNTILQDAYETDAIIGNILYFLTLTLSIILIYYILYETKNENKIIYIILLIYFSNSLIHLSKKLPKWLYQYNVTKDSNNYVKHILNISKNEFNNEIKSGNIEFRNLNFGYKKNHIILKDINLIIKNNEKIAIVGRSGSGKSSLSKLLLKFYKYNGEIFVDNQNIKKINTRYLRNKILYANQRTILYDISVMDNIKYGNNSESEHILKILNDYKLLEVFSGLKNGIYSDSGVQGNELSGGMQKIIIILRTIFKSEDTGSLVMIFDEPLAGLDSKTRQKIIKLINDKCSNKTLIIITHDKEILPYMDKIIDLSEINNKIHKYEKIRSVKK